MNSVKIRKSLLFLTMMVFVIGLSAGTSFSNSNDNALLFETPPFEDWIQWKNAGDIKFDKGRVGIAGGANNGDSAKIILPEPIDFSSEEGVTIEIEIDSKVKGQYLLIDFASSTYDNQAHSASPFALLTLFVRRDEDYTMEGNQHRMFAVFKNQGRPGYIMGGNSYYWEPLEFPLVIRIWINSTEFEVTLVDRELVNPKGDYVYRMKHKFELNEWNGGEGYVGLGTLSTGGINHNWISSVKVWRGYKMD